MSQNNIDFSGNPTGAGLMDDYLDKDQQNVLTSNSGIQRPSYAVAGTKWLDTSATPWVLKMYDGTDDTIIGTIDPSTHKFIASIPLTTTGDLIVQNEDGKPERLASGTAGTVLTSNGIGQIPSWQISLYQTTDNLSQSLDTSTTKYPSNAAVKAVMDTKQDIATAVNYKNITNCITEIPQDIKLELNNGVLTLKAGSKVYVPNGKNADGSLKFDSIVVASDLTYTYATNEKLMMFYTPSSNTLSGAPLTIIASGTTVPTTGNLVFYDTNDNTLGYYINGVLQSTKGLPLAIVNANTTQVTSIDQVFNGFGFIGSTVFALPGVKGLIPNGRNEDGSLKNIEFTTDKVFVGDLPNDSSRPQKIFLSPGGIVSWGSDGGNVQYYRTLPAQAPIIYCTAYIEEENKWIRSLASTTWEEELEFIDVADLTLNNGKITSFTPKTVFHAVDYNDFYNELNNKFQVVSTLPANPADGTFYYIPE